VGVGVGSVGVGVGVGVVFGGCGAVDEAEHWPLEHVCPLGQLFETPSRQPFTQTMPSQIRPGAPQALSLAHDAGGGVFGSVGGSAFVGPPAGVVGDWRFGVGAAFPVPASGFFLVLASFLSVTFESLDPTEDPLHATMTIPTTAAPNSNPTLPTRTMCSAQQNPCHPTTLTAFTHAPSRPPK
jgi:hypothetical protein